MPKWLLHNCHCHRPQEIPSENFQASLPTHCPQRKAEIGDLWLMTHHHEMVSICCYVVCSSGMIDVFWVSLDLSLGVMAGVHPWSPSPSTSQPQPMSSAAKKQAQSSTCKTNVGSYFLRLSWFYSQSLIILDGDTLIHTDMIILHFSTNFRELEWLVTALARAGLDPAPLCCDQADGRAQFATAIISGLGRNHRDSWRYTTFCLESHNCFKPHIEIIYCVLCFQSKY